MNWETIAAIASMALGLMGALLGVLAWYRGSVQKEYAAYRDFEHLKRNYGNVTTALNDLIDSQRDRHSEVMAVLGALGAMSRDIDAIARDLLELKALIIAKKSREP